MKKATFDDRAMPRGNLLIDEGRILHFWIAKVKVSNTTAFMCLYCSP